MRTACGARGLLSAAHLDALAELVAGNAHVLRAVLGEGPELRCALEEHSGPHMDLVHDTGSGRALWAQWSEPDAGWPETVLALPDCPAVTPAARAAGRTCPTPARTPGSSRRSGPPG